MRSSRILVCGLAAAGLLVPGLGPSGTAYADGETCNGLPATQVVGAEADPVTFGSDGPDVVVITTPYRITFRAKAGDDTVCAGPQSLVLGDDGDDTILAPQTGERLEADGMAGDDTITGGPGSDVLLGGDGGDVLVGHDGLDSLLGGGGDDRVSGGAGDDDVSGGTLYGGRAGDERFPDFSVSATPGVDQTAGGPGNDYVVDTASDETLRGGRGHDTFGLNSDSGADAESYCGGLPADDVHPVVDLGTGVVSGLGEDTFGGFELYQGGEYHATFVGTNGPDVFDAGSCGTVVIKARGGLDDITSYSCGFVAHGGPGADHISATGEATVTGGDGDDTITWGGSGGICYDPVSFAGDHGRDDLVLTEDASAWRIVNLARGFATAAHEARASLSGIEDVHQHGRPYQGKPERLVGTDGPNVLVGGDTHTVLRGLGGNDTLIGGSGRDTAYGGPGRDTCRTEVRRQCEGR